MSKVRIEYDEIFPVYSAHAADHSIGMMAEVSESQLDYWFFVEAQYRLAQRQMATALCEAHGHKGDKRVSWDCIVCSTKRAA
jgi:hypothetical protein